MKQKIEGADFTDDLRENIEMLKQMNDLKGAHHLIGVLSKIESDKTRLLKLVEEEKTLLEEIRKNATA